MTRRYTKDDVQHHVTGYAGPRLPAVNVKTQPWRVSESFRAAAEETGYDPDAFEEWAEAQSDDFWSDMFEFACQSGWEMLESDAQDIFGNGVKVWSEGRSGGWAVVDGLPNVEDWDAIKLGKWRRFENYARAYADDVPHQMAVLAVINAYEWKLEQKRSCEEQWNTELLRSLGVLA